MKRKASILAVSAGCGRPDVVRADGAGGTEQQAEPATTSVGRTGSTAEKRRGAGARAGSVVAGEGEKEGRGGGAGSGSSRGRVVLEVGGETGAEFSGACVLGGQEKELVGRVPGRFVYELDGRSLECEVRGAETSGGALEVFLRSDGGSRETRIRSRGGEVGFALTEDGTVLSTHSSDSGGSANQTSNVTSSSSSSVSSSSR